MTLAQLVTLLIGLPLSVYTLAAVFALIDLDDKSRALLRLTSRILLNVLLLLLAGPGVWIWLLTAYLVVITLHAAVFVGIRQALSSGRWISDSID
jgi:hypothetical protein